jgi:NTE family protein
MQCKGTRKYVIRAHSKASRRLAGFETSKCSWPPSRLSIGLQGGGSFGAFTWGVLDRLLDDERLAIDALSGASAGAVNAVVFESGLIEVGREEGKVRLERFWRRRVRRSPYRNLFGCMVF